ncbi:MAG: hypothetical protein OXB95_00100, partial [Rhodobacteraceae bacterium]|nr:hypothetical protein [Paracoccaceae bacterium]
MKLLPWTVDAGFHMNIDSDICRSFRYPAHAALDQAPAPAAAIGVQPGTVQIRPRAARFLIKAAV